MTNLNDPKVLKAQYQIMARFGELVPEINRLMELERSNRAEYGGHRKTCEAAAKALRIARAVDDAHRAGR